jgi:hypothetical protein
MVCRWSQNPPNGRKWSQQRGQEKIQRMSANPLTEPRITKPGTGFEPVTPSLPWKCSTQKIAHFAGLLGSFSGCHLSMVSKWSLTPEPIYGRNSATEKSRFFCSTFRPRLLSMAIERLYTPRQISQATGFSYWRILDACRTGKLKSVRPSGKTRGSLWISEDDWEDYLLSISTRSRLRKRIR